MTEVLYPVGIEGKDGSSLQVVEAQDIRCMDMGLSPKRSDQMEFFTM